MEKLTIEAVDRENLTEKDFIGIHEVMQDMWASDAGLGELAQCNDCGKMLSKEHVFWHLSKELIQEKVADIMRILWMNSISCTVCGGETRFIYGPSNVEKIKDRVLNSVDSFLVLCRSDKKGIVGFEEAYIDSLDRMFHLDFMDHYGNVWLSEIHKRVNSILWYVPDKILLLSALWFLEPYRSFQNLFELLNKFSRALPEKYLWTPGLIEMHRGGVTHRMSAGINHGISLKIEDDPVLRAKMTSVWEKYDCELMLYPNPIGMYKEQFTNGIKHFLKSIRKPVTQVEEIEQTLDSSVLVSA